MSDDRTPTEKGDCARCEDCGHPRSHHPYRHPFKPRRFGREHARCEHDEVRAFCEDCSVEDLTDEAEKRGRAEERARVVAHLRDVGAVIAAGEIERGEHWPKEGG